jgi:hypothetical protein
MSETAGGLPLPACFHRVMGATMEDADLMAYSMEELGSMVRELGA